MVNVLSVVEDPLDEVALAGALRSPLLQPQRRRPVLAGAEVRGRPGRRAWLGRRDRRALRPRPAAGRAGRESADARGAA